MKKSLKIPRFRNEDEERKFWSRIDLTEYFRPEDLKTIAEIRAMKPGKRKEREIAGFLETLEILNDPELMCQIRRSQAYFARGGKGTNFKDAFGKPRT